MVAYAEWLLMRVDVGIYLPDCIKPAFPVLDALFQTK